MNLQRRHLTSSQRAVLALELLPHFKAEAKERAGMRTDLMPKMAGGSQATRGPAREHAARVVGVSPSQVGYAQQLQREAPEELDRVRAGCHGGDVNTRRCGASIGWLQSSAAIGNMYAPRSSRFQ